MITRKKRGQAAMEFLMTYGWAILAAIIAIGVLAYFGVFNPSRLAGSAAVLNAPMNADAFNILDNDASCPGLGLDCINIDVTQNSGQTLNLDGAGADPAITLTSGGTGTCTATVAGITAWQSGQPQLLEFDCGASSLFGNGDSIAGDVIITYRTTGSSIDQTSTGNVRGVAQ